MKKVFLTALTFLFLVPVALAEDLEQITSYQKLKNITKQDHPAGSNLTMGFVGDEIRFLVFIQNKTEQTQIYRIEDILSKNLTYQENSTYRYQLGSGGTWSQIKDLKGEEHFPLSTQTLTVDSGVGYYFKFSTTVSNETPTNNVTLSNFVNIYDSTENLLKQTVTKVLVPNSTIKQVESTADSQEEKDYVNQVLEEEQRFIEETFFELAERGFQAELPSKEILNLDQQVSAQTNQNSENTNGTEEINLAELFFYFISIILLISVLLYLQKKFGIQQNDKSKF